MNRTSNTRWQISIRGMMLATAVLGVLTLVLSRVGWIEAGGVALAMLLLIGFRWLKGKPRWWMFRPVLAILAAATLWLVAVDLSHFVYWCPRCQLHWSEVQIRLFRSPLYQHHSYYNAPEISQIAADLGHPCPHVDLQQHHRLRLWGFAVAHPCINGIIGFSHEPWYTDELRDRMKTIGRQNPALAQEFHDEVLVRKNWAYWRGFVREFRTANDVNY